MEDKKLIAGLQAEISFYTRKTIDYFKYASGIAILFTALEAMNIPARLAHAARNPEVHSWFMYMGALCGFLCLALGLMNYNLRQAKRAHLNALTAEDK